MCLEDFACQVQTEARAVDLILLRLAAAEEGLEEVGLLVGRDTGSTIGNADFDSGTRVAADA